MWGRKNKEIVPIKDLFEKYRKTLRAPQKTVETEVIRVVGELTGIKLKESQVSYRVAGRTLSIQASSLIKQELKFHHEAILGELKQRLGEKNSPRCIL